MSANIFTSEHLLFTPASPNSEAIPTIFAFPNEYSVGITSLGYQVIWATLASRRDIQVSRLFTDSHESLPRQPELLGYSISWELDYINILNLLEFLEIPLRSSGRDERYPIVFGGGPVLTANPEPFADFFDVILLGDGENLLDNFIDAYKEVRRADRQTQLKHLAQIAGIYVPSLYEITYQDLIDGISLAIPENAIALPLSISPNPITQSLSPNSITELIETNQALSPNSITRSQSPNPITESILTNQALSPNPITELIETNQTLSPNSITRSQSPNPITELIETNQKIEGISENEITEGIVVEKAIASIRPTYIDIPPRVTKERIVAEKTRALRCGKQIGSIRPIYIDIPPRVTKQTYRGNTLSASTVVTEKAAWENIYMVEVVRSCPEMCRFCLASYLTLPFRTASLTDSLIPAIEKGLKVTNRIGLLGASVTQHPEFDLLLDYLAQPKYDDVRLSIASVRTNTVTQKLAQTLTKRGTTSITIAVESGSERLRQIINKKLTNEEIIQAAVNAKAGGLKSLKLYGMVGVPGEEMSDVEETVAMMADIKKAAPGLRLTLGCSTFVPKAHTPWQWFGVNPQAEKRLQYLQKKLRSQGIEFRPESYNWSVIQALISRGDRRLSYLLELTRHYGDSLGSFRRGFKELKGKLPELDFYVHSNWSTNQVLPWSHLEGPLSPATLIKHLGKGGIGSRNLRQ